MESLRSRLRQQSFVLSLGTTQPYCKALLLAAQVPTSSCSSSQAVQRGSRHCITGYHESQLYADPRNVLTAVVHCCFVKRKLVESGSCVKAGSDYSSFRRASLIPIRRDICLSSTFLNRQAIMSFARTWVSSICRTAAFLQMVGNRRADVFGMLSVSRHSPLYSRSAIIYNPDSPFPAIEGARRTPSAFVDKIQAPVVISEG